MTSRERVFAAINHQKTDRLPCDYSAHGEVSDGLKARLGVSNYEELLQALHVDIRRIPAPYGQPASEPDAQGYRRDMWGTRHRGDEPEWAASHRYNAPSDGLPDWIPPFTEESTVEDVHAHAWPDAAKLDFSDVHRQCEQYRGEYALVGAPWSPFFHEVGWLIGEENFFIWMATKAEVVQAIIDHIVDYEVEATRRFLEAAGGLIDIAFFGNDFGSQRALVISPAMWQQFIHAPLKRFFDLAHSFGCKVMQHSCGSVRPLIPRFIEAGVDVLDPIQVAASGMALADLYNDFGQKLSFHGGVDTQTILPFGTVEDVRALIRQYRELTREHGGYILAGSQEYMVDIPLDNILAIYE
ncbi:MAG: hypothetical protein HYV36_08570 [Lentisphaerae bacterium]|nr:hypothetical protein [Lentisphaerota bacterium]